MDITVTKKWKDKNGADMSVSDISQIEFKLYRSFTALSTNIPSDAKEVYSGTLTSSNNWSYSVSNLPTKENGAPVYYYVEETSVPNGYNVSYPDNAFSYSGSDGNCTMQIVNTQKADSTISLYIKKEWSGVTDISGINDYISPVDNYDKPVTVKLYRSLNTSAWAEYQTAEFTTDYTFTNLPMYNANEKPYYYRIEEVKISGYSVAYSEQEFCAKDLTSGSTKEITVTNSLIKNDLSIKKVWENGIFNGVSSIQIEIYRKKTENSLGNNTSSDTVVDSNADKEEVTAPVETTPTTTVSSSETTTTTTTSAQVSGEDKVEYDEENNILTVIPADGKSKSGIRGNQTADYDIKRAWGYKIPECYKGKTIKNIKVTLDRDVSNIKIAVIGNDETGNFTWDWKKKGENLVCENLVCELSDVSVVYSTD